MQEHLLGALQKAIAARLRYTDCLLHCLKTVPECVVVDGIVEKFAANAADSIEFTYESFLNRLSKISNEKGSLIWKKTIVQVLLQRRFWALLTDKYSFISLLNIDDCNAATLEIALNSLDKKPDQKERLLIYVKFAATNCDNLFLNSSSTSSSASLEKKDCVTVKDKKNAFAPPNRIWTEIVYAPQTMRLAWQKHWSKK